MSNPASNFSTLIRRAQKRLLQMHYESGVGHIGGNLSALDILMCLHHGVMSMNDEFVLSKGHAAGALYVTLWSLGHLQDEDLRQFHKDKTRLSGHPPVSGIPQISFATGSLGHGFSLANGLALARRIRKVPGRVFCLTSDGEWNEGSTWEALIFAAHQKLSNLTVVIDLNGLQGFGTTQEVANLDPMIDKLRTFDVDCLEIDGHDPAALENALRQTSDKPVVIVARTNKGRGISFMQDRMEWHYLPLTEAQYHQALADLAACVTPSANPS